jgi:hypothetical protein
MGNQPHATEPGLIPLYENFYIDFGKGTFSTTDSEATVRTRLAVIKYANASCYDTYSAATDNNGEDTLCVDPVPSSGAVTITRGTGGTSGLTFNYFFIGTLDATD